MKDYITEILDYAGNT